MLETPALSPFAVIWSLANNSWDQVDLHIMGAGEAGNKGDFNMVIYFSITKREFGHRPGIRGSGFFFYTPSSAHGFCPQGLTS